MASILTDLSNKKSEIDNSLYSEFNNFEIRMYKLAAYTATNL